MAFVLNPFTGVLDQVTDPYLEPFTFPATCLSGDLAGDCVRISGGVVAGAPQVRKVDISSYTGMPAVGIITVKTSATTCLVAYFGGLQSTGLTPGATYFVGADGRPTNIRPVGPAFIQIVGVALFETVLMLNPSMNMTKVL